jgi:hypothetical protein
MLSAGHTTVGQPEGTLGEALCDSGPVDEWRDSATADVGRRPWMTPASEESGRRASWPTWDTRFPTSLLTSLVTATLGAPPRSSWMRVCMSMRIVS